MQPNLVFGLGDDGDEVMRTAKVPIKRSRISTALMYDASQIATGVEPVFEFKGLKKNVVFPQATDVEFMSDIEEGRGIRNIEVTFKVPESPTDVRDIAAFEAYDRAMYRYVTDVVSIVNGSGWKRYIGLSSPRIEGRATYAFDPDGYGGPSFPYLSSLFYPDPNYRLSFEDWKHLPRGSSAVWRWYSDSQFVNLVYDRDLRSEGAPITLGDRLTLKIQTESSWLDMYGATYDSAREKYQQEIPKMLRERAVAEDKARRQSVHILSDWVDPVIADVFPPKN